MPHTNPPEPLKMEPFRQSEAFCGPASLKILLSYFGKNYTEDELAEIVGATREVGTEHKGLVEGVKKLGAHVFEKEHATIEDVRYWVNERRVPVIVGWWQIDGDHYSVVYHVDETHIHLMDPSEDCGTVSFALKEFMPIWHDLVGENPSREVQRWFAAIWF